MLGNDRIAEYLSEVLEYIKHNFVLENVFANDDVEASDAEFLRECNCEACDTGAENSRFPDCFGKSGRLSRKADVPSTVKAPKTQAPVFRVLPSESSYQDIPLDTEESFTETVLGYITERDLKESEVYKRAGIDRRLFSKIMCDNSYQPSKDTAIAISIGLELTYPEADELLERAGYKLSASSRRDLVVRYFLEKRVYVLTDINQVLYTLGEKIIGRY